MAGSGDQNVGHFSSSLGQEDAHIYFLANCKNKELGYGYGWFVINNDSCSNESLKPVFQQHKHHKALSACVALGSTLYAIGGIDSSLFQKQYNQFSREVEYIDVLRPKEGWKIGPPLLTQRERSYATIIGNKIYVMGNARAEDDVVPWAEVFDPLSKDKSNGWQPFYHSRGCPRSVSGHAILDGGKKILVHSPFQKSLYSLNIEKGSFDLYAKSFGPFFGPNTFMDGMMYCCVYSDSFIYGYDVTKRKISLEKVLGLENVPRRAPYALLCVGKGKLCAIWDSMDYEMRELHLICLKFFVSKEIDELGRLKLTASSVHRSEYNVDAHWMFDCVAVFPYHGEIEKSFAGISITPTPTPTPAVVAETMNPLPPTTINKKRRKKKKTNRNKNKDCTY